MLIFLKHDSINDKNHCNNSSLHLNNKGETLLNEDSVSLLNNLDSEINIRNKIDSVIKL